MSNTHLSRNFNDVKCEQVRFEDSIIVVRGLSERGGDYFRMGLDFLKVRRDYITHANQQH